MGGLLAKAVLGLAVAGCALPAVQYAQVAMLRTNTPNEAARIAPHDAKVLASALGHRFEENPAFKPGSGDLANIRAAITAQPLETKLISVLGLAYDAAGDTKQASSLMQLADRASRRDAIAGLYLIETASASGDVLKTLRHYNAVLSTQPELSSTLLPILASAITYPEIRAALKPYLAGGARWAPAFLTAASENAAANDLMALLLPISAELLRDEYRPALVRSLYRVALQGDQQTTARFGRAIIPGFSGSELTDLSVSPRTIDKRLGSLAWTFPPVQGVQVELGADNSLQINAEPLARGKVASRDLLIERHGSYELVQRLDYRSLSSKIVGRWRGECIIPNDNQIFWEQQLLVAEQKQTDRSVFSIPEKCQFVRISLFIEGPDSQFPSSFSIESITLNRLD